MESALLAELAKYGLGVIALAYGVRWLAGRYELLMARNEAVVQSMMDHCDSERAALTARIQVIEDRQFSEKRELLTMAVSALETNARAFEKLAQIETDSFPAVEPRKKER